MAIKKHDELKRQLIMDRAEELFSQKGFQNTTISQIARTCDISEAGIYEYFKNKEDLLFCIPEKHFTDLLKSLSNHLLGVRGSENKVRKLIWHYLLFMQERKQFARLFMLEIWSNQRFYQSEKTESLKNYWGVVKEILVEGINESVLRSNLDVLTCECMIFGTLNHIILSRVVFNLPFNLIDEGEVLEQLFWDAMGQKDTNDESLWGVTGKKAVILQAALDEFYKRGFAQTTISQISNRAGITDPTLYEYFNSKDEILMAIPELAVDKFLNDLKRNMAETASPENNLKLFLWNQINSYETYPEYYRVLLGELRCNPKFYNSQSYSVIKKYTKELMTILQSGIDTRTFRYDLNLRAVRHMYFGMLDQLLLYSMVRPADLKMSDKMERVYDLIINIIKIPINKEGEKE